jgi:hypothetical protein
MVNTTKQGTQSLWCTRSTLLYPWKTQSNLECGECGLLNKKQSE